LSKPNPEEVQAAKAVVEERIAREQNEHEMIIAAAPRPTWAEIRAAWGARIKSWFVVPAGSGASSGGLRMLPLSLVGLSLAGSGVWLFRKVRR